MHTLKAIIARKGRFCCSLKTGDFWLLNGCFRNCLPMRSHRKWWKNCWSKWFTRVEANFHCERFFTAQFSFVVVLFIKSIFICILNVVIRVNDFFLKCWVDEVQKCACSALFVHAILHGLFLINLIGRLSSVIIFNGKKTTTTIKIPLRFTRSQWI